MNKYEQIMNVVITANGQGTRMSKYESAKFMLPFKGKPIIHHLLELFPSAIVLTHYPIAELPTYKCPPTQSRKDTISYLNGWKNVLIVDSDIFIKKESLPRGIEKTEGDILFVKRESPSINAGIYYIRDVATLLSKMSGDDIVSGMSSPKRIECETIHLGTEEEYEHHCR